jgi:hypothetical protein
VFRTTLLPTPLPWRWRLQGPPKRRYPTATPYSVRSQKMASCIFTAVRTSHLANYLLSHETLTWLRPSLDRRASRVYEGVTKSFRTGHLERELQIVQLSATTCSCIAILWVSLVNFSAITLCVASQRVFIFVSVYFFMTQSGNFWIHPRILTSLRMETNFSGIRTLVKQGNMGKQKYEVW